MCENFLYGFKPTRWPPSAAHHHELLVGAGSNQVIYRLHKPPDIKLPSRVCDLSILKTCKVSYGRRQFLFGRHTGPLDTYRNDRNFAPETRLNFLPNPILGRF